MYLFLNEVNSADKMRCSRAHKKRFGSAGKETLLFPTSPSHGTC